MVKQKLWLTSNQHGMEHMQNLAVIAEFHEDYQNIAYR
jgi:hypothetical protein